MGEEAFHRCGLKSIDIPSKVEKIGYRCFSYCKSLREVIFESGSHLKEIGFRVFELCENVHVKIRKGFMVKYDWPKECHVEYFDDRFARSKGYVQASMWIRNPAKAPIFRFTRLK
jgi:hypothetical protein